MDSSKLKRYVYVYLEVSLQSQFYNANNTQTNEKNSIILPPSLQKAPFRIA